MDFSHLDHDGVCEYAVEVYVNVSANYDEFVALMVGEGEYEANADATLTHCLGAIQTSFRSSVRR